MPCAFLALKPLVQVRREPRSMAVCSTGKLGKSVSPRHVYIGQWFCRRPFTFASPNAPSSAPLGAGGISLHENDSVSGVVAARAAQYAASNSREGKSKMEGLIVVGGEVRANVGEERVHRVGNVVWLSAHCSWGSDTDGKATLLPSAVVLGGEGLGGPPRFDLASPPQTAAVGTIRPASGSLNPVPNYSPKRTRASPCLRASETLYFCCLISNLFSPKSLISHTRRLVPPRSRARKVLRGGSVRLCAQKKATGAQGIVAIKKSIPRHDCPSTGGPDQQLSRALFGNTTKTHPCSEPSGTPGT